MHPLETRLAAAWPVQAWRDVTVLLAVSGGADSVALLRALKAIPGGGEGRLVAAHVNHQLRGDESAADEAFVVDLCRRLGVECEVGRVRVDAATTPGGIGREAAARKARYDFLALAAARLGARFVVTAHTADDQAETILHRIIRGTGISGLVGMARARPLLLPSFAPDGAEPTWDPTAKCATLIRPLLSFRRADLVAYLEDLGQPYRRDASNTDVRFTRNRIRHDLLPRLAQELNPGVVDALLRLGTLAAGVQEVIDALVEDSYGRCVVVEGPAAVRIDTAHLAGQPQYLVRELLMAVWRKQGWPRQAMGLAQWDALQEMVLAEKPRQMFPGSVAAHRGPDWLRLSRTGR
jgi:tRNA(Ile)-lysidine synthase